MKPKCEGNFAYVAAVIIILYVQIPVKSDAEKQSAKILRSWQIWL